MSDRIVHLTPKDHAEAVAIFRAEVIGALTRRELSHGELRRELVALSQQRFRPPGCKTTRCFAVPTLERWYYAYKAVGLAGLRPAPRSDRGHARALTAELRELVLDIRRENQTVSVPVILRTLVADGRLARDAISAHALRRLYAEHQLDRRSLAAQSDGKTRLRWQAERPGVLWHADVCHGAPLVVGDRKLPVRVHALLDDASRYILALEARHTEQELDMLQLLVRAFRRHGLCGTLYLDNGATYRGDLLRIACARLGVALVHAKAYDPQARAKMERFWGTLRRGCLDFCGSVASLHDVNVRLWAAGQLFQLDEGYLAGARVLVAYCPLDVPLQPWIEHAGRLVRLHPVDPVQNGKRRRPIAVAPKSPKTSFDPAGALLDRAAGRRPEHEEGKR